MSGIRETPAPDWQPIATAPHEQEVLLGWWAEDGQGGCDWVAEVGTATWGWRRGTISNMSQHGQATHWMALPEPPVPEYRKEP